MEEQDQPIYPFMGNQLADDSLGSLQYQLDSGDIVEEIIRLLKQEVMVVDENKNYYWKRPEGTKALINQAGMGNIITVLKSRLTKIMILSDLEQSSINRMVADIHEDLTDDFYFNWENYELKDLATASMIVSLVTDTVHATLRKGYMGNYMKLLRSMHSIQEIQQGSFTPQNKQQQGMGDKISNILFNKRRR